MLTRFSLKLDKVSTWQAIKELVIEVNKRPVDGRKLVVSLPYNIKAYNFPPKGFVDNESISLKLENVTAREALCAILEASPLSMCYTYTHFDPHPIEPQFSPRSTIMLYNFSKVGNGQMKFFPKANWWKAELASVNQSEKAAFAISKKRYTFYGMVALILISVLRKITRKFKRIK